MAGKRNLAVLAGIVLRIANVLSFADAPRFVVRVSLKPPLFLMSLHDVPTIRKAERGFISSELRLRGEVGG